MAPEVSETGNEDQGDVIRIVGTRAGLVPGDVVRVRESAGRSDPGTSTPPQADPGPLAKWIKGAREESPGAAPRLP